MTARLVLVIAASMASAAGFAIAVGPAGTASAKAGATAFTGSASFSDATGDAHGAADVTAVAVADDPVTGAIELSVTAAGVSTIDGAAKPQVLVFLDTDRDATTGYAGFELNLIYWRNSQNSGVDINRWDGARWQQVPGYWRLGVLPRVDTLTWRFDKAALGGTTGFDFRVDSAIIDAAGNFAGRDLAPDVGTWSYTLSAPPRTTTVRYRPVIGAPTTAPARMTAGTRATVTFHVTGDGRPLQDAAMVCHPSVGGKAIAHAESFSAGVARVSFLVPKDAKGNQLTVRITIKAPSYREEGEYVDSATGRTGPLFTQHIGQSATRTVTLRVR